MASLGELTASLRADVREWTKPLKQAQADISGVARATTVANQQITQQAGPRSEAAKKLAAEMARASAAGLQWNRVTGLAERPGVTFSRVLQRIGQPAANLAGSLLGVNHMLGNMVERMAGFAIGGAVMGGVAIALTGLIALYSRLTSRTREAREEQERYSKKLLDDARGSWTQSARALEELNAALHNHERISANLRRAEASGTAISSIATGMGPLTGLVGKGIDALWDRLFVDPAKRAQAKATTAIGQGTRALSESVRAQLMDYAQALTDSIGLEQDSAFTRSQAAGVTQLLTQTLKDQNLTLAQRNQILRVLAGLESALDTQRAQRLALQEQLLAQNALRDATPLLRLERELEGELAQGNTTMERRLKLMRQLAEVREILTRVLPPASRNLGARNDLTRMGADAATEQQLREAANKIGASLAMTGIGGERGRNEVPESIKRRMEAIRSYLNQVASQLARTMADGILSGGKSIADALVSVFRMAIAEVIAAIIKQKLLDPLINLIMGAVGGRNALPGPLGSIPIPAIPLPLPFLQAAPAMATIRGGLRSQNGLTVMVDTPPNPDPVAISRDAYHLRLWSETARQAETLGFRLRVERR